MIFWNSHCQFLKLVCWSHRCVCYTLDDKKYKYYTHTHAAAHLVTPPTPLTSTTHSLSTLPDFHNLPLVTSSFSVTHLYCVHDNTHTQTHTQCCVTISPSLSSIFKETAPFYPRCFAPPETIKQEINRINNDLCREYHSFTLHCIFIDGLQCEVGSSWSWHWYSVVCFILLQFSASSEVLYLSRSTMSALWRYFNIRNDDRSETCSKICSVTILTI